MMDVLLVGGSTETADLLLVVVVADAAGNEIEGPEFELVFDTEIEVQWFVVVVVVVIVVVGQFVALHVIQ